MKELQLHFYQNDVSFRASKIDGFLQKSIPVSLRARVFLKKCYRSISGHAGRRRIYDTTGKKCFWSHVVIEAYQTVMTILHPHLDATGLYQSDIYNSFLQLYPLKILQWVSSDHTWTKGTETFLLWGRWTRILRWRERSQGRKNGSNCCKCVYRFLEHFLRFTRWSADGQWHPKLG